MIGDRCSCNDCKKDKRPHYIPEPYGLPKELQEAGKYRGTKPLKDKSKNDMMVAGTPVSLNRG